MTEVSCVEERVIVDGRIIIVWEKNWIKNQRKENYMPIVYELRFC